MSAVSKPNSQEVLSSQERGITRIESLGRLGNYFYSLGWRFIHGHAAAVLEYAFAGLDAPVKAEFSFIRAANLSEGYRANRGNPSPKEHFLDLFWINDGYKLGASGTIPVVVSTPDAFADGESSSIAVQQIHQDNFAAFLDTLDAADIKELWTNRMVLEMTGLRCVKEKFLFFKKAVERVGWKSMQPSFDAMVVGSGDPVGGQAYLEFYLHCITPMAVVDIPDDLMTRFNGVIESLDFPDTEPELLREIARQLGRIDLKLACGFSKTAITTLKCDREDLVFFLQHCFPRHSQWWLIHALRNPGLGGEQVADALNVAGTAALIQGQPELAMLSYEAALQVDPEAQSAAWNLGWLFAGLGDFTRAGEAFRHITRHYPRLSLSTNWPQVRGSAWPATPMDCGNFELPPGCAAWPRISVITPSFNQGQYIEETILSVLNQGYPNLQYIMVDGASNDDTGALLQRYRDRFDHLIIERDNGQTEAINKGLRLADGELIAWINSDDMYAPGALHRAALAWLENQADVIAGICLEHMDHRFLLANKPAAGNADFNPPQLARIFKYWFKGYYFYQPEAFFSKKILDAVGLLDESLYYSMDYDLWMRFSIAGAVLEVVDWPFAFFRKHESQKTANFIDCVEEQARVRDRHYQLEVGEERHHRISRDLKFLQGRKKPVVGVLTQRFGEIFSRSIRSEVEQFCQGNFICHLSDDENAPEIANADFVILLVHARNDLDTIKSLRAAKPGRLIAGWFWDHHHHLFENQAIAEALDFVIPGHAIYSGYLRNDQAFLEKSVPLCSTQWARQDASALFGEFGGGKRNHGLYGGFVEQAIEPKRTEFVREVMARLPSHSLTLLSESNLAGYFGKSERDRFAEWCRHSTSLIVPHHRELPARVFDALLAGQIPLVPWEAEDFDAIIPPALQESLPVLRYSMKNPNTVLKAQEDALRHITREGPDGARNRHLYALAHHTFSARINTILRLFELA